MYAKKRSHSICFYRSSIIGPRKLHCRALRSFRKDHSSREDRTATHVISVRFSFLTVRGTEAGSLCPDDSAPRGNALRIAGAPVAETSPRTRSPSSIQCIVLPLALCLFNLCAHLCGFAQDRTRIKSSRTRYLDGGTA